MPSSLQQGIEAAKSGDMQTALDFLKDAIIEEPENANVWVWIAAIIDDLDKQEVFLKKALEIDPENKPAQRGMAFIRRKKVGQIANPQARLSDYTKPITPFDNAQVAAVAPASTNAADAQNASTRRTAADAAPASPAQQQPATLPTPPPVRKMREKVDTLYIVLVAVIILVLCVIGVIFGASLLKLDLFTAKPNLDALPGATQGFGIFLYENAAYEKMEQHQGAPLYEEGIPVTTSQTPLIVVWSTNIPVSQLDFRHESGIRIEFNSIDLDSGAMILEPATSLDQGLYCFMQGTADQPANEIFYWCFRVTPAAP